MAIYGAASGDYPQALRYFEDSLEIAKRSGPRYFIGIQLNNIGVMHAMQGDYPKALGLHQRALEITKQLGDRRGIVISLMELTKIHLNQGDYSQAQATCEEVISIAEEIGVSPLLIMIFNVKGRLLRETGNIAEAIKIHKDALKMAEEIMEKGSEFDVLVNLARDYIACCPERAEGLLARIDQIADRLKTTSTLANARCIKVRLPVAQKRFGEAASYVGDMIQQAKEKVPVSLRIEVLYLAASIAFGMAEKEEAKDYLTQAETLASKIGHKPLLRQILELREKLKID